MKPIRIRTFFTAAVVMLLLFTTGLIWGNSLPDIPESKAQSEKVAEVVEPLLTPVVGAGNVTDHLVRKLAHLIEFGALGCELAALLILCRRVRPQPVANVLFYIFLVAVVDETIQIFSGRGSQLEDVWLDAAGASGGLALVLLVFGLISLLRGREQIHQRRT